ncbi:Holliday junction branch migration protein RuvA [Ichthyobacterium seriolicida]|uniref:Holliday junction branch migration complex subunit RuvA n=1 Tax=Ichthyobacterium seriolicida TaxID=242600 RepID=A0A1J1DWQ8_9FLAO|nr:Holliday junction branch migration protein RuvA [Ichthyobacterium seriolicida]BAV94303.1 Holliday junction DNA helicase RuvA [Ichthyobacterium seriolicida]
MITQIEGELLEKYPTQLVVKCGGIGYELNVSLNTSEKLGSAKEVKLLTHLHIREDAHILYGFADKLEREIFKLLISVSGIGATKAIVMLSSLKVEEIQQAVISEDASALERAKGIGNKAAQRIILELKNKIQNTFGLNEFDNANGTKGITKNEALTALEILGFSRKAVEVVLNKKLKNNPDITVENLIKEVLSDM